jgi:hypothetical protein
MLKVKVRVRDQIIEVLISPSNKAIFKLNGIILSSSLTNDE